MKKGLIIDLESETVANTDYRRVLYTSEHLQLVLMHLEPGVEIGEEVHELDQFIRIDQGRVHVLLGDTETEISDGYAVVIPAGVRHNFTNRGAVSVKLYSVYGPPEHKDGLVEKTKADEHEEHFDGKTTE